MDMININILAVCETGCASNGDFISDIHRMMHTGVEKYKGGVGLMLYNDMKKCVLAYCPR